MACLACLTLPSLHSGVAMLRELTIRWALTGLYQHCSPGEAGMRDVGNDFKDGMRL